MRPLPKRTEGHKPHRRAQNRVNARNTSTIKVKCHPWQLIVGRTASVVPRRHADAAAVSCVLTLPKFAELNGCCQLASHGGEGRTDAGGKAAHCGGCSQCDQRSNQGIFNQVLARLVSDQVEKETLEVL